jgi:hypothetical protein
MKRLAAELPADEPAAEVIEAAVNAREKSWHGPSLASLKS